MLPKSMDTEMLLLIPKIQNPHSPNDYLQETRFDDGVPYAVKNDYHSVKIKTAMIGIYPFIPNERAPRRRSSIKGTCPTRARAAARRRRASIATCTANTTSSSFEEELANGILQPSQVFEIRLPKRRDSIQRRTSITFNDEDINNVRKIEAISQVKEGAVVKQELGCQDIEYTQQIKKKIRALIDKVDAASGHYYNGTEYGTRGLEEETSTIQYDHDHDNDNHDDDTHKLYYSVYDDDDDDADDRIMGEDDDNEYEYADYGEDDDDTMMIDYNMTYTEADDDARFCQVTTNAETRTRSHKKSSQVGKYRK